MDISVDVETKGLDATGKKYITGCITLPTRNPTIYKTIICNTPETLWNTLLKLADKENKQHKNLNVYAHEHRYDLYNYIDFKKIKQLKINKTRPFIAEYKNNKGKTIIYFLDSRDIFDMSLERVGKLINYPKKAMPKILTNNKKISQQQLKKIQEYMVNDSLIVIKAIQHLKALLKKEHLKIQKIYTINQISIKYVIKKIKTATNKFPLIQQKIFYNPYFNAVHWTRKKNCLHSAYRSARIECFKTGYHTNATYIDCNSLFPFASTKIKFPDLTSEKLIFDPLKKMQLKELLNKTGITRCIIHNKTNDLGILLVRTIKGHNHCPKSNKTLIGTWTNYELKKAVDEGYKIISIYWSILYNNLPFNPLQKVITDLYKKRLNSKTDEESYFYKNLMNRSFGKMAQSKPRTEIIIDSLKKHDYYINKGFKQIQALGYNRLYEKPINTNPVTRNYFMPIITILLTGWARTFMYSQLKKIPLKDLLYTDTDSIIFTGQYLNKFKINNKMGCFKIVKIKKDIMIYAKKTYVMDNLIKIAGITLRKITPEIITDLNKGILTSKKMITLIKAKKTKDIGKFKPEIRNINKQLKKHAKTIKELDNIKVYIDQDLLSNNEKFKEYLLQNKINGGLING